MIKQIVKVTLARIADFLNLLRGYRLPAYFLERDRIDVLLFGIEPDVSKILKRKLRKGMTVLDVGGNVGLICRICASRVGRSGHVWSFEPDPYTRGFLEYNVRRCANVSISPIALSDANMTAKLHIHPRSGTSNSLLEFAASEEAVDVECMTLDSFLAQHPEIRPDCVKIDVEGAEPKVLAGMRKTLQRYPDLFLVIEFCPANLANGGCSPQAYCALLESMGLGMEIIHKDGRSTAVDGVDDLLAKLGGEIYCNLVCQKQP